MLGACVSTLLLAGCGGGGGGPMPRVELSSMPPGGNGGGGSPTDGQQGGDTTGSPTNSGRNTGGTTTNLATDVTNQNNGNLPQQQTQDTPQQATQDTPAQIETTQQQAIVFDGTIPMRDVFLNLHDAVRIDIDKYPPRFDLTLTVPVGADGELTFDSGFPHNFNRSVCIDPSKGCTAPRRRSPRGSIDTRTETLVQNPEPERLMRREKRWKESGGRVVGCGSSESGCITSVWYEKIPQAGVLDGWTITRSGKDSFTNGFTTRLSQDLTLRFGDGTQIRCATQYTCSQSVRKYNVTHGTHYGNPYHGGRETPDDQYKQVGHESVFVRTIVHERDINRWFVAAKHDGGDNYRAFGYWLNYDMIPSATGNPNWVVNPSFNTRRLFTAGTDPATDISGVSGTATYRGEAAGMMMWHEGDPFQRQRRISTFDGAPVTLTADFDAMRLGGRVDLAGRYHEADGYAGAGSSLKRWETIGPKEFRISQSVIGSDGTFAGGSIVPVGDSIEPGDSIGPLEKHSSHFQGRFYQPDGDNAPGSVMGTFGVQGGSDSHAFYRVEGAFGADKQ